MENIYIFAVNRNEKKYIDSFTVCSDSGNNSTDELFNQLIYAYGISFSSTLNVISYDQIPLKQSIQINKETALYGKLTRKSGKEKESGFKKGSKYLEVFLLRNDNWKIQLTND